MKNALLFRLVVLMAAMLCALSASAQETYAVYTSDNTTLTFYYDSDRSTRTGTTYDLNEGGVDPGWVSDHTNVNVTQVVFDPSFAGALPTSTYYWFYEMRNLESITGMDYLNTSEVTRMNDMFSRCYKLTCLDLSKYDISKVTEMNEMFRSCSALKTIYVGDGWRMSDMALNFSGNVFKDCISLVGGQGTTYDAAHVDADYAHIDGGPSNPGYFTEKPASLRGDVNGDNNVNISDVTILINLLLSSSTLPSTADCNQDSNVNISDVTALINFLLTGAWPEPIPQPVTETFTVNGVTFTMVMVEGGTFTMGATPEQGDEADEDERPAHQVTLSSYWIGQTEVTQALWLAVMGENPSYFQGDLEKPVENVSRYECQAFINTLNQITGRNFKLPTEAQWEFAARGGNLSQGYKYAGSNTLDDVAWYYYDGCTDLTTHAVANKQPNELGLYDMSGNVKEWCSDNYAPYSSEPQTDPVGPSGDVNRVYRGGGWSSTANECRVTYRYSNRYWANFLGMRLAL